MYKKNVSKMITYDFMIEKVLKTLKKVTRSTLVIWIKWNFLMLKRYSFPGSSNVVILSRVTQY